MTNVPCPCTQDCPKRTAVCRLSCMKYKVYDLLKKKEDQNRAKMREVQQIDYDYRRIQAKRMRRHQ